MTVEDFAKLKLKLRTPDVTADAAYAIFCRNSKEYTQHFCIDEDVLREEGITDFEQYAASYPGEKQLVSILLMRKCSFPFIVFHVTRTPDRVRMMRVRFFNLSLRHLRSDITKKEMNAVFAFKLNDAQDELVP